jgi:hypothetical protein
MSEDDITTLERDAEIGWKDAANKISPANYIKLLEQGLDLTQVLSAISKGEVGASIESIEAQVALITSPDGSVAPNASPCAAGGPLNRGTKCGAKSHKRTSPASKKRLTLDERIGKYRSKWENRLMKDQIMCEEAEYRYKRSQLLVAALEQEQILHEHGITVFEEYINQNQAKKTEDEEKIEEVETAAG